MLKTIGWVGFLGLLAVLIYFLISQGIISIPGVGPAPTAVQPALVKTQPIPPPPAVPPPQAHVVQPPPPPPPPTNPDAGKLRGTKEKDWDHTWVTIRGKKVMAIFNVRLTDSLVVGITNPFGEVSSGVDQLPQGFLDSWGINGNVIDQKVSAIVEQVKAATQAQAAQTQNNAAAAADAESVTMGFKVMEVMNKSEILGSVQAGDFGFRIIHISGIDASGMAPDNSYTLKVWPNGDFQYASGPGATSQIESYTGLQPGSAH
jgi:hypothetical protein